MATKKKTTKTTTTDEVETTNVENQEVVETANTETPVETPVDSSEPVTEEETSVETPVESETVTETPVDEAPVTEETPVETPVDENPVETPVETPVDSSEPVTEEESPVDSEEDTEESDSSEIENRIIREEMSRTYVIRYSYSSASKHFAVKKTMNLNDIYGQFIKNRTAYVALTNMSDFNKVFNFFMSHQVTYNSMVIPELSKKQFLTRLRTNTEYAIMRWR